MVRTRSLWMLAVVAGVSCVWFTASRADEEPAAPAQPDQIAQLLARIETLEKRIAVLEGKEQAARQVNAIFAPANPWAPQMNHQPLPLNGGAIVYPPQFTDPVRPKARVWLLKQTEQK